MSRLVGRIGSTGASTGPHLSVEQEDCSEMLNALVNLKSDLDMAIAARDGYQRRAEMLLAALDRLSVQDGEEG